MEKILKDFNFQGWEVKIGVDEEYAEPFLGKLYSAHKDINPDNLRVEKILNSEGKISKQFSSLNYFLPIAYVEKEGKIELSIFNTNDVSEMLDERKRFFGIYAIDVDILTKEMNDYNLNSNDIWKEVIEEEVTNLGHLLNDEVYFYEASRGDERMWGGESYDIEVTTQIALDELR